jgi:hypothetical protein
MSATLGIALVGNSPAGTRATLAPNRRSKAASIETARENLLCGDRCAVGLTQLGVTRRTAESGPFPAIGMSSDLVRSLEAEHPP